MRIKELRTKYHLTQQDLAMEFNVSSQTILNWENEINDPSIKDLIKMADYFEVSLDYLCGRDENNSKINEFCELLKSLNRDNFIEYIKECLIEIKNKNKDN